MKQILRFFSLLSAGFGILTILRFPPGLPSGIAWLPKLMAGAWAPLWGILGGLGALYSWVTDDRKTFAKNRMLIAWHHPLRTSDRAAPQPAHLCRG